jgi:hypothetical protein
MKLRTACLKVDKHKSRVAIVIINWNGFNDTTECLKSLRKVDYPNYDIVVVDNASTNGLPYEIKKMFPEIELIKNQENLGVAEGINVGMRYALKNGADYIFLLNNDTVVKEDAISQLVRVLENERDIGLASAVVNVYGHSNPYKVEHYGVYANPETGISAVVITKNAPYNYLSGCALMARSSFIKQVGMLDKRFFIYGEDKDWCFRFVKNGYRLTVADKAIVWHKHSASSGGPCSPTSLYYSIRNDRLFCEKIKKRTFGWLLKCYIPSNVGLHYRFFRPGYSNRTSAILLGLFDGCLKKFGKKDDSKTKICIFRFFAIIVNYALESTRKAKCFLKKQ